MFNTDLCKAFLSVNIPFNKHINPDFKHFLEEYMEESVSDQPTLRKGYVKNSYKETVKEKKDIRKKIWVSIDKTIDANDRFIASVVVETLILDRPGEHFLSNLEHLEKVNHSTIYILFENFLFNMA